MKFSSAPSPSPACAQVHSINSRAGHLCHATRQSLTATTPPMEGLRHQLGACHSMHRRSGQERGAPASSQHPHHHPSGVHQRLLRVAGPGLPVQPPVRPPLFLPNSTMLIPLHPLSRLLPFACNTRPALSASQKARDELMNLLSHAWKACIINRTCEHGPLHGWGACRRAGQAGPVTRLMSCTEQELRTYRCCTSCHGSL